MVECFSKPDFLFILIICARGHGGYRHEINVSGAETGEIFHLHLWSNLAKSLIENGRIIG